MSRDKLIFGRTPLKRDTLIRQLAFREAGHSVAIYFRNRQLGFPQNSNRLPNDSATCRAA